MAYQRLVVVLYLFAVANGFLLRQNSSALNELEDYIEKKKPEINQRYRLLYHVAGAVGWINDPNGFSFFKGEYHLFYQFYPYDAIWGPMHWGHVSSSDLVNWKYLPTALIPEEEMCFSGSAIAQEEKLVLMYTAHIIDGENSYHQNQYLAYSDNGVDFYKYQGNPVIPSAPNGSPEFRDPKVWKHEDYYYVVIGSQTSDKRGTVLLYRSKDLITWEFLRVLVESGKDMGFMWECPDFFELNGKYVLLMSPQGLEPQGDRYKNIYQTGYIIGDFNYETFEFIPEVEFQELDFGHDFYAAQTTDHEGKRYIVGWFNMWEKPLPEAKDGWAGAMTLVRELELIDNRIIMKPLQEQINLRDEIIIADDLSSDQSIEFSKTADIVIQGDLNKNIDILIDGLEGGDKVFIRWDPLVKKVILDINGDIRQVEWTPINSTSWRLFIDASSLELFCGEGEVVFSSRAFPIGNWKVTNLSPQALKVEAYTISRSVPL